jgi:hypothetical protein
MEKAYYELRRDSNPDPPLSLGVFYPFELRSLLVSILVLVDILFTHIGISIRIIFSHLDKAKLIIIFIILNNLYLNIYQCLLPYQKSASNF